jgi:hypothetical protein
LQQSSIKKKLLGVQEAFVTLDGLFFKILDPLYFGGL